MRIHRLQGRGLAPVEKLLVLGLKQQLGQGVSQGEPGEQRGGAETGDRGEPGGPQGVQRGRQGEVWSLGRGLEETLGVARGLGLFAPCWTPRWDRARGQGVSGAPGSGELGLGVVEALLLLPIGASPADQTLLAGCVRGIGAGVGESLATVLTLEGFLASVNALMFLQVMLELESFATMRALELS